jgi:hypothetical protein
VHYSAICDPAGSYCQIDPVSVFSIMSAPLTASVTVPAHSPSNADVLAWLSKNNSGLDACSKTLSDGRYIPSFGKLHFWFGGYLMAMERKEPATDERDGQANAEDKISWPFDPTTLQLLALTCFPTLHSTVLIEQFLDQVRGASDHPEKTTTSVLKLSHTTIVNGDTKEQREKMERLPRHANG